jgi:hypothetical protein
VLKTFKCKISSSLLLLLIFCFILLISISRFSVLSKSFLYGGRPSFCRSLICYVTPLMLLFILDKLSSQGTSLEAFNEHIKSADNNQNVYEAFDKTLPLILFILCYS